MDFRARGRLRDIHTRIAEDQPANADRFIDRLINKGASLIEQALRGRVVPKYHTPTIREVFEGDYRIIYQAQENAIAILTIRNFSELLPTDPENL